MSIDNQNNPLANIRLMTPPWLKYPNLSECTIGWRMGYGEDYQYQFLDWLDTLDSKQQKQYQALFPYPSFWLYKQWEKRVIADDDEYYIEGVDLWLNHGMMKYNKQQYINSPDNHEFVFFGQDSTENTDNACLNLWHSLPFSRDIFDYLYIGQYIIAEKAQVFENDELAKQITKTADPQQIMALDKQIKNFNPVIWDKVKYSVALNAYYYKFSQHQALRDFLLSTDDKILVFADPTDDVWGIGATQNHNICDILAWRGENLLGFSLMEVRDELRALYQNYQLCSF